MTSEAHNPQGDVNQQTFVGLTDGEMQDLLDLGLGSPYQPADSPGMPESMTPLQEEFTATGRGGELFVGPYLIEARLGSGGMGVVYRARHLRMGRIVALKVLSPDLLASEKAVGRFLREVRALANLRHPHIVTAFDAQLNDQEHYLAMELVEGSDLDFLVRTQGPFSIPETAEIVRQTAEALQCVHAQGLVHRDIKPSNLMLDVNGQIKVTDFGLTKLGITPQTAVEDGLTHAGTILGSIDYLAPEQARDFRIATPTADIYSLGCTLGYLLTGASPFRRSNIIETLTAHQTDLPGSLVELRADVPAALNQLYLEMLEKDPNKRPPTMSVVAERMSEFIPSPKPHWFLRRGGPPAVMPAHSPLVRTATLQRGQTTRVGPGSAVVQTPANVLDSSAAGRQLVVAEGSRLPTFQEWLLLACLWAACMALVSG